MLDEREVSELLAIVPSEFVAARNAAVKAARAAGDKERATALATLRRIHPAEWALNVAARDETDVVAAFADAAADVLAAQEAAMSGGEASGLRDALRTVRDRTADLAATARRVLDDAGLHGAGTSRADLSGRLATIATNPAALGLLRRGLLGAEDPGAADPFADGGPQSTDRPPAEPRRAGGPRGRTKAPTGADKGSPAPVDLAAERARRRAAAESERAIAAASTELAEAERSLAKLEGVAAKTARRLEAASRELEDAQQAHDTATAERDAAAERASAARETLADLERRAPET